MRRAAFRHVSGVAAITVLSSVLQVLLPRPLLSYPRALVRAVSLGPGASNFGHADIAHNARLGCVPRINCGVTYHGTTSCDRQEGLDIELFVLRSARQPYMFLVGFHAYRRATGRLHFSATDNTGRTPLTGT